MNRNEMIKWLLENTTREQWVFGNNLQGDNKGWTTCCDLANNIMLVSHTFGEAVITINDVFEPVNEQPTTREEMIKWLSENTTREQWVTGFELPKFKTTLHDTPWMVYNELDGYCVAHMWSHKGDKSTIKIDDVFEPVNEQPVYIDGAVYEISRENGKPRRFLYDSVTNSFNGIGFYCHIFGSKIQGNADVTYFKLISEPCSERATVAKEIINNIRRGADMYFNDKPMSDDHGELVGLVNGLKQLLDLPETATLTELFNTVESIELRDKPVREPSSAVKILNDAAEVPIGKVMSSEITDDGVNITMGLNPEHPLFKPEPSSAVKILNDAAECIGDRAAERDTDNERSMLATVNAFNAMYGTELTETQGWMFLAFLKASRAKGGTFREDDYTDGAAYFALAGECDGNVRR